jgi:hypothetical protein
MNVLGYQAMADRLPEYPGSKDTLRMLKQFLTILGCFFLAVLLSWPVVFSFDLWVFKDRSSFLNLDYLLDKHLRLGLDAFYSYGLLPVFVQHFLFRIFGRGYWPMIGATGVAVVLMALFWALLLRHLPRGKIWLVSIVAVTPLILWINPNFPYSLAVLSMLFALISVLEGRLNSALAFAVMGCFCVPSLPWVLTGLLIIVIGVEYWFVKRSGVELLRRMLPGICVFTGIAFSMAVFFGLRSVLATILPVLGVRFYRATGLGTVHALISFLHPPGRSLKYYAAYYVASPASWFALSTLALALLSALAVKRMIAERSLSPAPLFVALCGILQLVFAFFVYGNQSQHVIYDPVMAAGMFVGISLLRSERRRKAALLIFTGVGILAETGQAYKTFTAWRTTRPSAETVNLYSEPAWTAEWSGIVRMSAEQKVLLLSYATGVHNYFPSIRNPEVWFLYPGQLLQSDRQRILDAIQDADVIVEDRNGSSAVVDWDQDIEARLETMCQTSSTQNFRIWWKQAPDPAACNRQNARIESTVGGDVIHFRLK